jgi:hypothetical protein
MPRTLLTLLLCACTAASAQTPYENRAQILREAGADGTLIALALHCKQTRDDVNRLADKLEALTMALARSKAVALDGDTYYDLVHDSFLQTREVLRLAQPSEASYKDQCAEVQDKTQKKLAQ